MKIMIAVLCGMVASMAAQAQLARYTPAQSRHASLVSPLRVQETAAPLRIQTGNLPGKHGMRTGKTLVIAGGVLLVGGIVLASTADALYYNTSTTNGTTTEEGDLKGGLGVLMIVGGVGMITPGLIIWHKSKKRYDQYLMEHPQQSLNINVGAAGAGLTYRF